MGRMRRRTHRDTRDAASAGGVVRIKLLTGRKLVMPMTGPPPPYLTIEVPPENTPPPGTTPEPGARVVCKRVDVEKYQQMTYKEMVRDGIVKPDPFAPPPDGKPPQS